MYVVHTTYTRHIFERLITNLFACQSVKGPDVFFFKYLFTAMKCWHLPCWQPSQGDLKNYVQGIRMQTVKSNSALREPNNDLLTIEIV